ncbi:MAG: hypothetical protein ACLQU1_25345 [Bryobacteraceae bacterium]
MAENKQVSSEERQVDRLLRTYPHPRPALAPEYQRFFLDHYRSNRSSAGILNGLVARLEGWMHKRVAEAAIPGAAILETGLVP